MSFIETPRFPDDVGYGSRGGPIYNTSIIEIKSGAEHRNINWESALCRYDVAYGVRDQDDLEELIEFFHAMAGRTHGFRFKDHSDYKSCKIYETIAATDCFLGYGDGVETEWQIKKEYDAGNLDRSYRKITKPIEGTVLVRVAYVIKTEGVDYTIDYTTGIISLVSPAPNGLPVQAGFEFDVPCRFDSDQLPVKLENYLNASASVPLMEIRV